MNARNPQTKTGNQSNTRNIAKSSRAARLPRRLGMGLFAAAVCFCGALQAAGLPSSNSGNMPSGMLPPPAAPVNSVRQFIATPPVLANQGDVVFCNLVSTNDDPRMVTIYLFAQNAITGDIEVNQNSSNVLDGKQPMLFLGQTMNASREPKLAYCEFEIEGNISELRGSVQLRTANGTSIVPAL